LAEYTIYYYRDEKGNYPVYDYVVGLPKNHKAKVLAYVDYLSEMGPRMRRPMADYLGDKTGLYEIRPAPHRVIYCYFEGKKIILLHAFRKKTDKIRKEDIERALMAKEFSEVYARHDMIEYEED